MGRFISSDSVNYLGVDGSLTSYNLYAYCGNNPINLRDPSGKIAVATLILIGSIVVGCLAAGHTAATSYKYTETVDILNTIVSGYCGFLACYTLGMSLYGIYLDFCNCEGYIPITNIGGKSTNCIPQEAFDAYDYATSHNGSPRPNYKGGSIFLNDGRENSPILPRQYAPFREYDIYPKIAGNNRGVERIIIGTGNPAPAWYTPDHYNSFLPLDLNAR